MRSKSWRNPSKTSCPLRPIFSSAGSAVWKPAIRWHLSALSVDSRVFIHIWLTNPRTLWIKFKLSGQNCDLKRQTIFSAPLISIASMALFFLAGKAGIKVMSPSLSTVSGTVMITYLAVKVWPCWFFRQICPPAFDSSCFPCLSLSLPISPAKIRITE